MPSIINEELLKDPEIKTLFERYDSEAKIAGSMSYGDEMFLHRKKSNDALKEIQELLKRRK